MEGAALAEQKRLDVALFTAWHTARFALNGYADKGRLAGRKSLSDLLIGGKVEQPADPQAIQNAQAIAFFHRLKAQGFPVEISRNEIN